MRRTYFIETYFVTLVYLPIYDRSNALDFGYNQLRLEE